MRRSVWRSGFYFKLLVFAVVIFIFWTIVGYKFTVDDEDFPDDVAYDIFIDETREDHNHLPLDEEMKEEIDKLEKKRLRSDKSDDFEDPIIMWWTEFTREPGVSRSCGDRSCFFTNDRRYKNHKNMKMFVFYGTDFSPSDLPLPRHAHHQWALFHEESPKNNYLLCHDDALSLFNYTSTFRRESDYPIHTQHILSLDWLLQNTYTKTTNQKNRYQDEDGLSSVVFIQSDCDPPSDRDTFVKTLMKYIKVDSYGKCLNNKQLPKYLQNPIEGMAHEDLYELLSHYKFALAMENAVCQDYMTEKLWRPLMVGTVPIIFGSSAVKDFLPSNHSGLVITDFQSAKDLAEYIKYLESHDEEYDKLRVWKQHGVSNQYLTNILRTREWEPDEVNNWSPSHMNFVEGFECFLCRKVHQSMERNELGLLPMQNWGNVKHYGCPKPAKFDSSGHYGMDAGWRDIWASFWEQEKKNAKSLLDCVRRKENNCGHRKGQIRDSDF